MVLFLGKGVRTILKSNMVSIIRQISKNIKYRLAVLYVNMHTKDIHIEGNEDDGYRFIITEKRPWIVRGYVIRRGRDRFTGYADTTKEELYQIFTGAYGDILQLALHSGCVSETINIPTKYIDKLVKQLEFLS